MKSPDDGVTTFLFRSKPPDELSEILLVSIADDDESAAPAIRLGPRASWSRRSVRMRQLTECTESWRRGKP